MGSSAPDPMTANDDSRMTSSLDLDGPDPQRTTTAEKAAGVPAGFDEPEECGSSWGDVRCVAQTGEALKPVTVDAGS